MPSGSPDGDGSAPIEIAPDLTERSLAGAGGSAGVGPQPAPFIGDSVAAVELYRAEIAALGAGDGVRAAPLLHALGDLLAGADGDVAAVDAYAQAARVDPSFVTPLLPLRRLLVARADWAGLVALYDRALENPALPAADKADLWVERGRVLEDRLHRDADAAASYRAALVTPAPLAAGAVEVTVDHPPALLALLTLGARVGDAAAVETALAGLLRLSRGSPADSGLGAALARAQRAAPGDGEGRALRTVDEALAGPLAGPATPLLDQLEALARARDSRVRAAALGDLARRAATAGETFDPTQAAAMLREQGRIFRDELDDPLAAFAAFREALALSPAHPLLAADMADIADRLNRGDLLEQVFDQCPDVLDSGAPNPLRREIILRHAEVLARQGHAADALALLQVHPALAAAEPRVAAVESVLRARTGDAAALASAFENEGERGSGLPGARAFLRAAAIAEWALGQGERAEALMRRALALAPGYRPAVDALTAKLRAAGRGAALASVLESELASLSPQIAADEAPDDGRRRALLESLVTLCRDELRDPARARVHQRRLAAEAPPGPERLRALARLLDLDLLLDAQRAPGSDGAGDGADVAATLTALGEAAGDAGLAGVLFAEAARALSATAGGAVSDDQRRRAAELYQRALAAEPSADAAAGLEALLDGAPLTGGPTRVDALVGELAGAEARGAVAVARALRFRLADAQVTGGQGEAALATLQSLRTAGDRLARAFSLDLARAAGRADWEARLHTEAVVDHTPTPSEDLDLAEALERQGDLPAAAARFRQVLASAPSMDAALGVLRGAAVLPQTPVSDLVAAFRATAEQSGDHAALAAALRHEADFLAAAATVSAGVTPPPVAAVAAVTAPASGDPAGVADEAVWSWLRAVRAGDPAGIGQSLLALARATDDQDGSAPALLARAAARARLAGGVEAQRVQVLAWREASASPALQHGLTDVPLPPPPAPALVGVAEARAARALAAGGVLGVALDMERALDAELGGRPAEALQAYGRVLARDPASVEALEGVRRVAQAAGDPVGQARACARLGTLAKGPSAVALLGESARLFQQAGHTDEAITLCWNLLALEPSDPGTTARLGALLEAGMAATENAADYERLLSHRLSLLPGEHADRVPLLTARAQHRLRRLGDRTAAIQDFKRILKISPYHEEALGALAALAQAEQLPRDAARLLERYVAVARDPARVAQARLDLAAAYDTLLDPARAVEVLQHAAELSPADVRPRQRLVELLLRVSDWRGALAALRAWDQTTTAPRDKAALYVRIGTLLRDHAMDASGAAQSFRLAADLDPLGEGARALVALYESLGDGPGRARVIAREIAELRLALGADPLDVARLRRLHEFLEREAAGLAAVPVGAVASAAAAPGDALVPVAQVLALLGQAPEPPDAPPARRRLGAGISATAFWGRLAVPQSAGFLGEIWAVIAAAASEMHRPDAAALSRLALSRQNRVAPGTETRLGWVEAAAVALGIEGLTCYASPQPLGDGGDAGVVAVELPEPVLVFDRAALAGGAAARFRFGRALGLMRQRATVIDRISADELREVFLAAGAVAGAPHAADRPGGPSAHTVKALGHALARKDRKTLSLQASRFGFEADDVQAWRRAVLGTADRLGLVVSGDAAAAARVMAGGYGGPVGTAELREAPAAMELLSFALQLDYLALRDEAGGAGG